MSIKSLITVFVLLFVLGVPLSFGSELIENSSYSGHKTTIRYSIWGGADEVTNARAVCQQFVKIHPEIRVDVSVYPWGQYWAKVQTEIASGIAPDIMSFYSAGFGVWVSRGALLNLDPLVKKYKVNLDAFQPGVLASSSWDGHLYSMPTDIANWCLVYSKTAMEQSGIPQDQWPQVDKSMPWNQFQYLAKRLTLRNADGSFSQYGMATTQNWDEVMMGMDNGQIVDRQVQPTKATVINNLPLQNALIKLFQSEYGDLTTLGRSPLNSGNFVNSTDTLLLSPRFAMGTTGPWALKELKEAGIRFGLAPLPAGTQPSNLLNVNSVAIYSGTKHPDESFLLTQYIASLPVEKLVGSELKGVPTLVAAEDSFIHNKYHIPGCEAFIHDLKISIPAITTNIKDITTSRDNWLNTLDTDLSNLYDARLANLPRKNGAISPADYKKFTEEMNHSVAQMVPQRLPKLQSDIQDAIALANIPSPSNLVRVWLPIGFVLGIVACGFFYLRSISSSEEVDSAKYRSDKSDSKTGLLFISPWLIGFVLFTLGPVIAALFLSFTRWNMITSPHWVGFQQYTLMPQDVKFLIGLKNTFLYALFVIPISLIGGLGTAGLLASQVRGSNFFKALIYFPALFTGAEAAVLWVNMLNKDHGVINAILGWFHIAPVNWIDENHAFYAVLLMNVFWIGGAMIIYYAGMKQIPITLYEAAELDGASTVRKFLRITIPLLSPVILFMVVITTIGAFQVFTPALFFADSSNDIGQPGNSMRFYAVNIYDKAFNQLQMGSACSYAIVLFLIIFAITLIQLKISKKLVFTEGGE